jgi:hypothetical protein
MAVYHKSEVEVLRWDDIQFAYYVGEAQRIGRWLWNYFPPQVGGKKENEIKANADKIRAATPELLLPSNERFDDARKESEAHGLIGPR